MLDKEQALRILKLLSIFEALGLMSDKVIPDYLFDELIKIVDELTDIVLEKQNEN